MEADLSGVALIAAFGLAAAVAVTAGWLLLRVGRPGRLARKSPDA